MLFRMLNNKLSVQYENGKVAKYVSGERMHNGKFIIIAHKQDCYQAQGFIFLVYVGKLNRNRIKNYKGSWVIKSEIINSTVPS